MGSYTSSNVLLPPFLFIFVSVRRVTLERDQDAIKTSNTYRSRAARASSFQCWLLAMHNISFHIMDVLMFITSFI